MLLKEYEMVSTQQYQIELHQLSKHFNLPTNDFIGFDKTGDLVWWVKQRDLSGRYKILGTLNDIRLNNPQVNDPVPEDFSLNGIKWI